MKIKNILVTVLLFFCADTFAQANKITDYLANNQLYLIYKNHNISFNDINLTTIIKLLGKPIRIKKEKW